MDKEMKHCADCGFCYVHELDHFLSGCLSTPKQVAA